MRFKTNILAAALFLAICVALGILLFGEFKSEDADIGAELLTVGDSSEQPSASDSASNEADEMALPLDDRLEEVQAFRWRLLIEDSRARLIPPPPPPNIPIIQLHNDRQELALAGNGEAALELYLALEFCRGAPITEAEFQDEMLQLLTDRKVKGAVQTDDTTAAERLLERKFQLCAGVDDSLQDTAEAYLEIASESGIPAAQVLHANYLINKLGADSTQEEINDATGFLRLAKNAGDADAYYWSGYLGIVGNIGDDKISALADLIVADAVYSNHGIRDNLGKLIGREFALLMPHEQQRVTAAASELLAADTCCSFMYGRSWEDLLDE